MQTFSKQEVIDKVVARFQLFNVRNPKATNMGLTDHEVNILGEISAALSNDTPKVYSQKQYDVRELFI